jgi:hypothetical protein
MGVQAFLNLIARGELVGVAVLIVIGVVLIVLAPAKEPVERDRKSGANGSHPLPTAIPG